MLMLAPTVFANTLYAQLPDSTTTPSSSTSALPDNAVTITSPQDGQKVPIGQDLQVTGTSMANAASDCKITVNLNRIKPYQPAVAAGPGVANDYSQWSITLTSKYTPIEEGQNRVAAKISCSNDPNLIQFAHVNVTGVASSSSSSVSDMTTQSSSSSSQSNIQRQSRMPPSSTSALPDNAVTITSPYTGQVLFFF
jgi:hypothetical protein